MDVQFIPFHNRLHSFSTSYKLVIVGFSAKLGAPTPFPAHLMTPNQTPTGIEKAVARVGSQTELAARLGVTQQVISVWLRRGWVPVHRAAEIEHYTGVSRQSLIKPRWRELLELPAG